MLWSSGFNDQPTIREVYFTQGDQRMINARLIVVGGAKQTEITLKKLPTTIGRSKNASITLPHGLVSRQHCEIFEEQGILYVRDLNSLNGTF